MFCERLGGAGTEDQPIQSFCFQALCFLHVSRVDPHNINPVCVYFTIMAQARSRAMITMVSGKSTWSWMNLVHLQNMALTDSSEGNFSWQLHQVSMFYINACKMHSSCRWRSNRQSFKVFGKRKLFSCVTTTELLVTWSIKKCVCVALSSWRPSGDTCHCLYSQYFSYICSFLSVCAERLIELSNLTYSFVCYFYFLFVFTLPANFIDFWPLMFLNNNSIWKEQEGRTILDVKDSLCSISTSVLMWKKDLTLKNKRDYKSLSRWMCQARFGFTDSTRYLLHDEDLIGNFNQIALPHRYLLHI